MSVLSELLSSEKVGLDDINKIVPDLELIIEDIKTDVLQYTQDIYIKHSNSAKEKRALLNECMEIKEDMEKLVLTGEDDIKQDLIKATNDLNINVTSLKIINFILRILDTFLKLNEGLVNYEHLLDNKDYLVSMKLISKLEEIVDHIPEDEYIDAIAMLKIEDKKFMLTDNLINMFNRNVLITQNQMEINSFKIVKDLMQVQQALQALFYSSSVAYPLHSIAKQLWNIFFVPTVDNIVRIDVKEDSHSYYMYITIIDSTKKSSYKEVFLNLHVILNFLKDHFCMYLNENLTTLEYIGIDMRDNLSELIIKHCLEDTIPSDMEGLQNYKHVIADIEQLEISLKNSYIFSENTTSLVEYANNIDILFINKKCHDYILTSQQIMKKNLHEMTEVGVPYNFNNPMLNTSEDFPQCSVSKSVVELLDFMEKIMLQAITASEICAGRLFCILQNISVKYCQFIPEYHSKLLLTIPQQVALFYNNCLFIAHQLSLWNERFCPNLPGPLSTSAFTQEIDQLKYVASEIFAKYVDSQKKEIIDTMSSSGLDGSALEDLPAVTEKSIRQCLRQQELLKTVWHKVLSYSAYNKTIGSILNCLCLYIIESIVKFEDISQKVSERLMEVLKIVMMRGPKLFTEPKEVILYVPSWYKLLELNFVLGASLIDINDRWAEGKGPLALHYQPKEVKSLVRAIFQNTDIRAAVLAKIQEQ